MVFLVQWRRVRGQKNNRCVCVSMAAKYSSQEEGSFVGGVVSRAALGGVDSQNYRGSGGSD
jgi:hypothetical protein